MVAIWLGLTAFIVGAFTYRMGTSETVSSTGKNPWGFQQESPKRPDKVILSDKEWKAKLTDSQYKILRNHGTETAFCGVFYDNHKTGTYHCAGCDLPLFRSDAKFDSGTGWPSFFQPVKKENVWLRLDTSYGMRRWEVLCSRCDGHLGHVFEDGPKPTGLRFCMNSDAMGFTEEK